MSNIIQSNAKAMANKKENNDKQTVLSIMNDLLDSNKMRTRFEDLLGNRTATFISSLVSLVNASPQLQQAFSEAPMTVIQAALKAATFDLPIEPSLGFAFITPFNNSHKNENGTWSKRMEATFILGWKGMHQLAMRTGVYKTINVVDIREGELKSYNRLTEEIVLDFIEDEAERQSKDIIGFVGCFTLNNGFMKTIYMTKEQIDAHEKKFRKGNDKSKGWKDDWFSMAKKTIYRELIGKWGVMSIEYQNREESKALASQIAEEQTDINDTNTGYADFTEVDESTGEVIENG